MQQLFLIGIFGEAISFNCCNKCVHGSCNRKYVYDPIIGMLSKSKGLILRVAGVLHVLFHLDVPGDIPCTIKEKAIIAAQDFVDVCCQHTAFLAGRGDIEDAIQQLKLGLFSVFLCKLSFSTCIFL